MLKEGKAWFATNNKNSYGFWLFLFFFFFNLDITRSNQTVLSSVSFLCNWIVLVDKWVSEIVNISIYHLTVIGC